LTAKSLKIQGKDFTFTITEGEALKEFWRKEGADFRRWKKFKLKMAKKAL